MATFSVRRDTSVFFLFLSLVVSGLSSGSTAGRRTYGGELTFTNNTLTTASYGLEGREEIFSDANRKARDELSADMDQLCGQRGDCRVEKRQDKYGETSYRVIYQQGGADEWWYEITLDPYVIEVITKPATLPQFESYRQRIEQDIFGLAARHGLKPTWEWGGGHIHIGAFSAFHESPLLLRNFIVDFWNHTELATGAMEEDDSNAYGFSKLKPELQGKARRAVAAFDAGKISVQRLVQRLHDEVYLDDLPARYLRQTKDLLASLPAGHPLKARAREIGRGFRQGEYGALEMVDKMETDVYPGPLTQQYAQEVEEVLAKLKTTDSRRKQGQAILAKYRSGELNDHDFVSQIHYEVYIGTLEKRRRINDEDFLDFSKYHALNLTRMVNPKIKPEARTVEMRAIRTQLSTSEFLRLLELWEARLNYLETLTEPVAFEPARVGTIAARAKRFWAYVAEAGLDPMAYLFILPDKWKAQFYKLAGHLSVNRESCGDAIAQAGAR